MIGGVKRDNSIFKKILGKKSDKKSRNKIEKDQEKVDLLYFFNCFSFNITLMLK